MRGLSLWGPPAIYALAIFGLSSMSAPPAPPHQLTDKQVHVLAFAGLALSLVRAMAGGTWSGVTGATAAKAALVATVYGATDEWHQSLVPGRHADLLDLGADGLGAAAAAGILCVWAWWGRRRAPADRKVTPDAGKVSDTP